jgi:arginase family enzyme
VRGRRGDGTLISSKICSCFLLTARKGRLVGMDVVEVNPSIGTPQDIKETTSTACALVRSALGSTLL